MATYLLSPYMAFSLCVHIHGISASSYSYKDSVPISLELNLSDLYDHLNLIASLEDLSLNNTTLAAEVSCIN